MSNAMKRYPEWKMREKYEWTKPDGTDLTASRFSEFWKLCRIQHPRKRIFIRWATF